MTTEEKQLLFKDLCARLPYECMLRVEGDWFDDEEREPYDCKLTPYSFMDLVVNHDCDVKPYLRPMSSMTEDERDECRTLGGVISHNVQNDTWAICAFAPEAYGWLNEHHFDYRGLIPMGLALEATEGMYND